MLRMKPVKDAKKAEDYYGKSDGGYYLGKDGLRREWGCKGAARLGLSGPPEFEQFRNVLHGLDPNTGEQLTAKLIDGRLAAWDVTGSVPKGVTTALERGDGRIQDAIWDTMHEALAMLETYATTRVRVGGQQSDRVTGNLLAYLVEHPDTRPVVDESLPAGHRWRVMPDWDRHIHGVISNLTFDEVEDKWKAVKFRPIMDIRKYFDRCFDTILAGKLANDLGYELETTWKADGRYHSWDIKGIPATVIDKNSRRSAEVEEAEASIVAERKQANANAPDALSAVAKDKLGATSRRVKRDDLTLGECREYWNSRITAEEGDAIAETIRRAQLGLNPRPDNRAGQAVDFALRHHGEQESLIRWEELAATAMEHSIGAASPAAIEAAARRQGVIFAELGGKRVVTTPELQDEERFITGMAAAGLGKARPVGVSDHLKRGTLNDGQWAVAQGLLASVNRVSLVEGPAGAGKTFALQKFDEGLRLAGERGTYLATTSDAVGVLAKDGFAAHTVARFIRDETMQAAAAGGRVVIDESSMLGHKDAYRLFKVAEKHKLKLIFIGDPMQHGSVGRGAFMRILKEYGGIQPFCLTQLMRQESPEFRAIATQLSQGQTLAGFDALGTLGWVRHIEDDTDRFRHVAADYVQALDDKKSVLVISPTHAEAASITQEIRRQLREAGRLSCDEREFTRLVNANASEAERGLARTYRPGDVIQYHQNAAKGIKKGTRLTVTDPAAVNLADAGKFSLYRPEKISLAAGDVIRYTGTVTSLDGRHKLENGASHTIAGFSGNGNLVLANGWEVAADAGHFRSGFVETSFGSQGKTVQRVIIGMSSQSLGATNQEQLYVSASRAKEKVTIYTDDVAAVREGVQESSQKLAALDLLPKEPLPGDDTGHLRRWTALNAKRAEYDTPLPPQPERPGPGGGLSPSLAARRLAEIRGQESQSHGR